ncbi:hypothetical protein [Allohahella marinimesophila]|uniref:Uncharacterized protein n=1 Tax=Allohahella marinimesophila TaxID=1054972 RepID=A0ABP7P294_9GAMM
MPIQEAAVRINGGSQIALKHYTLPVPQARKAIGMAEFLQLLIGKLQFLRSLQRKALPG